MTPTILAVVGVAVATLLFSIHREMRVVLRKMLQSQPPATPPDSATYEQWSHELHRFRNTLQTEIDALKSAQTELFQAVADGIDHADRNEKRVRGIVLGAKRRFEASEYYDPGVDAEADTLPEHDAPPGREEGVLPLQGDVESDNGRSAWSAVPGRLDHA